jgi:hypothetical protein
MTSSSLNTIPSKIHTMNIPWSEKVNHTIKAWVVSLLLLALPQDLVAQNCWWCDGPKPIIGASYAIGKTTEVKLNNSQFEKIQEPACNCPADNHHSAANFDLWIASGGRVNIWAFARAQHTNTWLTYFNNVYTTTWRSFGPWIQLDLWSVLKLSGSYTFGAHDVTRQSFRNAQDKTTQEVKQQTLSLEAALWYKAARVGVGMDQQSFPVTFPGRHIDNFTSKSLRVFARVWF